MTLSRDELTTGTIEELETFGELVKSLSPEDLARPTRCDGWTVGDVAAHVIGTVVDIVEGRLEGLGSPEVTKREVDERKGRSATELADELAGAAKAAQDLLAVFDDAAWEGPSPGGYEGTLRHGIEAIYYDTFLHGDDILAAVGRPSVRGAGTRAAVHHVAFELQKRGWGPAALDFDGVGEVLVGDGSGQRLTGDPLPFVLAATGRAEPAAAGLDSIINIYAE